MLNDFLAIFSLLSLDDLAGRVSGDSADTKTPQTDTCSYCGAPALFCFSTRMVCEDCMKRYGAQQELHKQNI